MSAPTNSPRLRLTLADTAEIRSWSSGEVVAAETFDRESGEPVPGGLHCPAIFGSHPVSSCACGRLSGERHPEMLCVHCDTVAPRVALGEARYGHIGLVAPVVNPLAVVPVGGMPLAKLLGMPGKQVRDLVYSSEGGARTIREMLQKLDIDAEIAALRRDLDSTGAKPSHRDNNRRQRLALLEAVQANGGRLGALVLDAVPVIPTRFRRPRLDRPSGRLRTCGLEYLYVRVLNRNVRLRKLISLAAPEVILQNERRMLQQAVDALFLGLNEKDSNGHIQKRIRGLDRSLQWGQRSLRPLLGRGKRVDYSARSVAVPDARLGPDECVLPRDHVALTLFEPVVVNRLLAARQAYTREDALRLIALRDPAVWDALDEAVRGRMVLIGRPGREQPDRFQAFAPRLGDQRAIGLPVAVMAGWGMTSGETVDVHLILSDLAREEAERLRPSVSPALPVIPTDVVLGCCLLTLPAVGPAGETPAFCAQNLDHLRLALASGKVRPRQRIRLRLRPGERVDDAKGSSGREFDPTGVPVQQAIETTAGRALVNELRPAGFPYLNDTWDAPYLRWLTAATHRRDGAAASALLDRLGRLARERLTASGVSFAATDGDVPPSAHVNQYAADIDRARRNIERGHLTWMEGVNRLAELHGAMADARTKQVVQALHERGSGDPCASAVALAVRAGAGVTSVALRPTFAQVGHIEPFTGWAREHVREARWPLTVRMALRDPVAVGRPLQRFIRPSLRDGLDPHDYWACAADVRVTRVARLIDDLVPRFLAGRLDPVLRDLTVTTADCGTRRGLTLLGDEREFHSGALGDLLPGRAVLNPPWPVRIRSLIYCEAERGVCQLCHGIDPRTGTLPPLGAAVGRRAVFELAETLGGYRQIRRYLNNWSHWNTVQRRLTYRLAPLYTDRDSPIVNVLDLLNLSWNWWRCVLAACDGTVSAIRSTAAGKAVVVRTAEREVEHRPIPHGRWVFVNEGDVVRTGDPLSAGHPYLREVESLCGHDRAVKELYLALLGLIDFGGASIVRLTHAVELLVRRMSNPSLAGIGEVAARGRSDLLRAFAEAPRRRLLPAALAGATDPADSATARYLFGFAAIATPSG